MVDDSLKLIGHLFGNLAVGRGRLAEREAWTGVQEEAPLRRDVWSVVILLGEVLREQAGDAHSLCRSASANAIVQGADAMLAYRIGDDVKLTPECHGG